MILTKLEVKHFGKWKDFTLDLSGGVNVILGRNEAGKSTLCAFLYAMFFGLPNESKKLGIRQDWRKRYLPWSGGAMEGTLHFQADGRSYVLSRKLGKMRKGDKVSLKDGITWEEVSDIAPDEIGRHFFGLGAEAFLRTMFIGQMGTVIASGADDEILKRLANLHQSGEEDISYQKVSELLEKAKHELISKSEKTGILPKLEQDIERLEQELAEEESLMRQYRDDIVQRAQQKEQAEKLLQEQKQWTEQKALAKQHGRFCAAQKNAAEKERLTKRKEENAAKISAQQDKLQSIREKEKKFSSFADFTQADLLGLAQAEEEREKTLEKIAQAEQKQKELAEMEQKKKEQTGRLPRGVNLPMLLIAAAVAVMGIVFGLMASPILFVLLPISVLLGAVAFLGLKERKQQKEELAALEKALEMLQREESVGETQALSQQLERLNQKLDAALKPVGAANVREFTAILEEKQKLKQEERNAETELAFLTEADQQIEEDLKRMQPMEETEDFSPQAVSYSGPAEEELDLLLSQNHEKQLEIQRLIESAGFRLDHVFSQMRSADIILSELEQKKEEKEHFLFQYNALCVAQECMEESYLELKQDFAPVLNRRVGEILSTLTDGKYEELKIADDYKIMLKEQESGQIVSAEYLSGGTYDILYFALRLGITQVIFSDKIPLLVLDDAFLQMDDVRAQKAADFTKNNLSAEQILYFTCHESQADLFGNNKNRIMI